MIKDHLIAQSVNALRDIAIQFHDTQQLRDRISDIVTPLAKGDITGLERALAAERGEEVSTEPYVVSIILSNRLMRDIYGLPYGSPYDISYEMSDGTIMRSKANE